MDYEKLHKETITKLQQMVNSGKIAVEVACGICADFVPESEDERIRQALITQYQGDGCLCNFGTRISYKDIVAWLEKQGEQKQPKELTNSEFVEKCKGLSRLEQHILALVPTRPIDAIKVDARTIRYLVEQEQGEQKPADEVGNYDHKEVLQTIINEQKPAWSEEDERILNGLISSLARIGANTRTDSTSINYTFSREINWLKSLKERYTWKPSDEQMNTLEQWLKDNQYKGDARYCYPIFELLYQDLKKLKG